jgi:hypothetical protein
MGAAQSGDFEPNASESSDRGHSDRAVGTAQSQSGRNLFVDLCRCDVDHGVDRDGPNSRRELRNLGTPYFETLSPGVRGKGATMVPGGRLPAVSQVTEHTHPPGAGATPRGMPTRDPPYRPKSTLEALPPSPNRFGSGDASQSSNTQGGVGVVLQKTDAGLFQVVKMVRDGPAHRSCKISKGDTLVKINGQTLDDPLSHLSGPAESNVVLSFQKGNGDVEQVTLTRDAACFPDEMAFHVQRLTSATVKPSTAAPVRPQQEFAGLDPRMSLLMGYQEPGSKSGSQPVSQASAQIVSHGNGTPQRAAVPYVSDYTGEEVSMTLPAREYGNSNTGYSRDGSTVTLPPIDYSEYKKREMQGQMPELGKYVPKEPSRIEEAYAEFLRSDDLSTHIPYEASKSQGSYTVVSSSNGNALRIERDASSSLNHRADYSQEGSYQLAQAPE